MRPRQGQAATASSWSRRFRVTLVGMPEWAAHRPHRLIYSTNESGAWQIYAWDRFRETHRRLTSQSTGVRHAKITPDGTTVCWFADDDGSEIGTWMAQPFQHGTAAPLVAAVPLVADAPPSWRTGLALGPDGAVAVGTALDGEYIIRSGRIGGATRVLHRANSFATVADISQDGRLVAVEHCAARDLHTDGDLHRALTIYDPGTGDAVAELSEADGHGVIGARFSPAPGDRRVAFLHDRFDRLLPGIWDPDSGERLDPVLDLPGDVEIVDWLPDASGLLLVHSYHGRDQLYRLASPANRLTPIPHATGTITDVAARPDGQIWYRVSDGANPPRVRVADTGEAVLASGTVRGGAYDAFEFTNSAGDRVHGFLAKPSGQPPYPTLFLVHGGPHQHDADSWHPRVQAFVDHGWAVAMVNYRGSTGRGKDWMRRTIGDPGRPEVDDLVTARAALIRRGLSDPARIAIAGGSWGGYLTLLAVGLEPAGWQAAIAVSPIADVVAAYQDQATGTRSLVRSLFGGAPADAPDLYEDRSPVTHAYRVRTPVLIIAGENDTRCPLRQIHRYVRRLPAAVRCDLDIRPIGHGSAVVDEQIRQTSAMLEFVSRHVPGVRRPTRHSTGR